MFNGLNISGSSLTAHKTMLDTISNNIANINTATKDGDSTYQRQRVLFKATQDIKSDTLGVSVTNIVKAEREDRLVYDPENPYADEDGYVHYPDIDITEEMADMIVAQRGYQLSLSVFNNMKEIYETTLTIGK